MDSKRQEAADQAYASYDFGEGVEVDDASGWERVTPGEVWTRPVFVRTDDGEPDGVACHRLTFTVRFQPDSEVITETYAIDQKGVIWGLHVRESLLRSVKVVVLCANSNGSPEFWTCAPECTGEQITNGDHYELAKQEAAANGYEEPMIAFDSSDPAAHQFGDILTWL